MNRGLTPSYLSLATWGTGCSVARNRQSGVAVALGPRAGRHS
jgi:hypothetical protein